GYDLPDRFVASVAEAVTELVDTPADVPAPRPVPPPPEALIATPRTKGIRSDGSPDYVHTMCGIKLPPLEETCSSDEEFVRRYLAATVAAKYTNSPIGGVIARGARFHLMSSTLDDVLFFWEDGKVVDVIQGFKSHLIESLEAYRNSIPLLNEYILSTRVD